MMNTLTNIFSHSVMIGMPALVLFLLCAMCIGSILYTMEMYAPRRVKILLYTILSILGATSALLCGVYALGILML